MALNFFTQVAPKPGGKGSGDENQQQQPISFPVSLEQIAISEVNELTITEHNKVKLSMGIGHTLVDKPLKCKDASAHVCLEWSNEARLTIQHSRLDVKRLTSTLDCYDVSWKALRCVNQVLTDCVNLDSGHHWYGGYADKFQYWPFQKNKRLMAAYQVNDSYPGEIGGVVERYFFSTSGVGIFVDHEVPLYFSLNEPEGQMCFTAKYEKYPYVNIENVPPVLNYKICHADNVKDLHLKMSDLFIDKPVGIPDELLFKRPIWSTWAQYKKAINQSTVLEFARDILCNNFTLAQLEIDDEWTPAYGDMVFDQNKFPDAADMVKELSDQNIRVTLWVHPFFNTDSKAFAEAAINSMLIRQVDSPAPAITPWWDGKIAAILDVSNESAVEWFKSKLNILKTDYNITSFKFDAGETSWGPHVYSQAKMTTNPAEAYPMKWVKLAAEADPLYRQEVRVGYKTQKYPVFVRMMDKFSNWGHENAFLSIIPCVLTYGLLGYHFVLPDMIGGNAYNDSPDPELYVRWVQLNTFLPGMQYSIVPWKYNTTIINIARKFTEMRETFAPILLKYARESTRTGEPIVRPLWWVDPTDEVTWTIDDEFLVGDEILVAPIMIQSARSRDIYFPLGNWRNDLHDKTEIIKGPTWRRYFSVDIDELAYFTKVDNN